MGLFNIFKKKELADQSPEGKILLAMPMFTKADRYNLALIVDELRNYWSLDVSSIDGNDDTAILTIDGERIAIAFMPVQIPMSDIEGTAQYAYNWQTAMEELKDFSGHAIVSVMAGTKSTVERFRILTKVLYSILSTSNAVGVYMGGQSLLISRGQYLESAEELKNDESPISLWIYIGLRKTDTGNCGYTYGLTQFGKQEMEIINSRLGLEEIYEFLANTCSYVIDNDVIFNSGETIGNSAEQKIKIISSKGRFVDGQSLKLHI